MTRLTEEEIEDLKWRMKMAVEARDTEELASVLDDLSGSMQEASKDAERRLPFISRKRMKLRFLRWWMRREARKRRAHRGDEN